MTDNDAIKPSNDGDPGYDPCVITNEIWWNSLYDGTSNKSACDTQPKNEGNSIVSNTITIPAYKWLVCIGNPKLPVLSIAVTGDVKRPNIIQRWFLKKLCAIEWLPYREY